MPEEKKPRQRGTIIELGAGRFKVCVYVGLAPDGSRAYHRKTLKDSTRAKAEKHVREVAARAEAGTYFLPPKTTFGEVLDDWLDRLARKGRRESTLVAYGDQINKHVRPALGALPLRQLTRRHVQAVYDRMQDAGYNPSTIKKVHSRIYSAARHAVRQGALASNPAEHVELPPCPKPRKARVFDERAALAFVEAAEQRPEDLVFVFALLTGMRPQEFIGLEYPQITLVRQGESERGHVRVVRTVVRRRGGGWYFGEPKTESSRRGFFFPASLYRRLEDRRGAHLEWLRRLGHAHQLVFTNTVGGPLTQRNLTARDFRRVLTRAGLGHEGYTLYTLRRSHATLALLAGEGLKTLADRMGHRSVEFTQDEYVDALPEMQAAASDKLENLLLRTRLAPSGADAVM